MFPQPWWKPCADRMPCSHSTRAANCPPPLSSAPSFSHRPPAAGTSLSWISLGPSNQVLTKSTWKISESSQARLPQASSTQSSVTGISGNVGSALRLSHSGSSYRCTCAHRTPTGNPGFHCSLWVCLARQLLVFPPGGQLPSAAAPHGKPCDKRCPLSGRPESNVRLLPGIIV